MKAYFFTCLSAILIFSSSLFSAEREADTVLYENNFTSQKNIKIGGKGVSYEILKDFAEKPGNTLKVNIESNHEDGKSWPQVYFTFEDPVLIDLTTSAEFDFYYSTTGKKMLAGFGAKPVNTAQDYFFPLEKLKADNWHKLRIPLSPRKDKSAEITGLSFYLHEAHSDDKESITMHINNLRIVSGGKIVAQAYSSLTPAELAPAFMDIEATNLLINAYLTEGGDQIPPRGWDFGGRSGTEKRFKYADSPVSGRAFQITGRLDQGTVVNQGGITIVPGEQYKLTGYIKASEDFKGSGGIGLAMDGWHRFWGYKIQKDSVKSDWHYFETIFTPQPEKSNVARFVYYLHEGSSGTLSLARPILEPMTKKGQELSKNILADNDFEERYAKAKASGKLRGGPPSDDYELVWSDEFDGDTIDESKWHVVHVRNYIETRKTITSPECISLNGKGQLIMTIFSRDNIMYHPYLSTQNKFATTYGYFECRARFHKEDSVNFAFWLMPQGRMDYRDPVNTGMEIDIMECITPSQEMIVHTTHWYSEGVYRSGGSVGRRIPGLCDGFRHIGFEWTPDDYIFYVDGVETFRFNKKEHPITTVDEVIRLSGAVNVRKRDEWLSEERKDISSFEVDYVRVYKKK